MGRDAGTRRARGPEWRKKRKRKLREPEAVPPEEQQCNRGVT